MLTIEQCETNAKRIDFYEDERAVYRQLAATMLDNQKLRDALEITHRRCKALGWSEPELRLIEQALSETQDNNTISGA